MVEKTFECAFCGKASGFGRKAASAQAPKSANPYSKETRKYRCEECSRINEIERPAYDWSLIDRD